jgi:PAT family beta-lactamase induction signal transducer AmpG
MQKLNRTKKAERNPWTWLPSLYFAEGLPYVVVMTLSVIMYKRLGISNTDIALYTSWLYLPWVIKPFWSPLVDLLKTKRFWIVIMQLIIGAGLAGVALTIPAPNFFKYSLAFFWLLAFSSATHDIAADGFYMLGLSEQKQAFFVGIRSTFYRLAMITGQGLIVIVAGYFEASTGLGAEDIVVTTTPDAPLSQTFDPSALNRISDGEEVRIICSEDLKLSTVKITAERFDSLKEQVRQHNSSLGFYQMEEAQKANQETSWWKSHLSDPLAKNLKKLFGVEQRPNKNALTGNVGLVHFYLSGPPEAGEEIVLNFGRKSGDKSVKLVEGSRFVFNDKNWNESAFALIQLDPKLNKESQTVFEVRSGNISLAWAITFGILAALFFLFFIYHYFILPYPYADRRSTEEESPNWAREFMLTFVDFFRKKNIGVILGFLLLYRLGESQLVKLASPFLLDSRETGGLGLTTGDLGIIYGTIGMIALTVGGILGGMVASRKGLKYWLWWMIIAMNLPNLVYVFLSYVMPDSYFIIGASVAVEQFGYGFGFTAYMLYMIYISDGKYKTAHFAIATGFMALGMMIPGMISGWLQEIIGYQHFFIWVMLCTIPSFIIAFFIKIDPEFGKSENKG